MPRPLIEPFKIKTVEALPLSTREQRKAWIEAAHYNVFSLTTEQVVIDLLTDSGTAAMSDIQWSEMIKADESYAGSRAFHELERVTKDLTGMKHVIPVHQGRAAEHLFFSTVMKPNDLVLSNGFFDTTAANVEATGAEARNITIAEGKDPFLDHPFKGNIDLALLEETLNSESDRVRAVLLTITNNTGGGQPVSFENISATAKLCKEHGVLFIMDACRFAENSYFIKLRESEFNDETPHAIARKCFDLCDAITFSGKKDGLANIGGFLCLRDDSLCEQLKNRLILIEGFPTYGGMAGYSLAALHQGLKEVVDERYLEYRLRTIEWMVEKLDAAGVPVIKPAGGHALYIEASKFFPHIPRGELPGITLSTELYISGGIRCCELGTVAFGSRDDDGNHIHPPLELVRLAIPRRVYTEAHMGYVVECVIEAYEKREVLSGFGFRKEYEVLRHFRSEFTEL